MISAAVLLGFVGLISFAGYACVRTVLDRREKGAETERTRQERRRTAGQLAESFNAVFDWEEPLCKGGHDRSSRIFSIELEKNWQGDRPILFVGCLRDICSDGAGGYRVVVDRDSFGRGQYTFATELRLSLHAPKAIIDSFLREHAEALADDSSGGVAVVAMITSITDGEERGVDWEVVQKKTGHGDLLGIVYAGDAFFLDRKNRAASDD